MAKRRDGFPRIAQRNGLMGMGWLALITVLWAAYPAMANPPFGSTADTTFDIIRSDDPSAMTCLISLGRGDRQIWDKRVDGEPVVRAHLFRAQYSDGTKIEIAINPELQHPRNQAIRFAAPLGRLPTLLRQGIRRFSVHDGDQGFHAGTGQIVVYSERATQRESYAHLEESLFHEAVHASLDDIHRLAPKWIAAQRADGRFMTGYAAQRPDREDLAETALFAYAILHHPERLPPADTKATVAAVPNRIAYIRDYIFQPGAPLTYSTGHPLPCPE